MAEVLGNLVVLGRVDRVVLVVHGGREVHDHAGHESRGSHASLTRQEQSGYDATHCELDRSWSGRVPVLCLAFAIFQASVLLEQLFGMP